MYSTHNDDGVNNIDKIPNYHVRVEFIACKRVYINAR